MKRTIGLLLTLCLMLSCVSALAIKDYSGTLGNEATFETLEEARASAPAVVAGMPNASGNYVAHPALNDFPAGTAYVYRSPDIYAGFCSPRMNTTYLVYSPEKFEDKAAALDYIKGLGLTDMVDELRGSVILVTPASANGTYGVSDQKNFYNLITAIFAQKGNVTGGKAADGEYYGTWKNLYLIGIDAGATFFNNFVVVNENMISRVAGMILINGKMDRLSKVTSLIPVYLVNADAATIAKYQAANEVDSWKEDAGTIMYFDQQFPVRKVIVAEGDDTVAFIKDANERIFKHSTRIQVLKNGTISANTPWQNTTGDCAPYSLNRRVSFGKDGMTALGAQIIKTYDPEMFKDIQTVDGEYLTTWYEIIPASIVNGTAAEASVPLVLCFAGTGDDCLQVAEELGWINVCEEKGVAIVSPGHEGIFDSSAGEGVEFQTQPLLIDYMLEKYPELDPTRVYVTGYSRGGRTTLKVVMACPEKLAAAVPCAANQFNITEEQDAHLYETKLPCMFLTSTSDMGSIFNATNDTPADALVKTMNYFARYNEIDEITALDGATYPISGFAADTEIHMLVNDEFWNHRFFLNDDDGVPMLGISVTEGLQHALYQPYAFLAWDYMEHFSRNLETLEITYTADPLGF